MKNIAMYLILGVLIIVLSIEGVIIYKDFINNTKEENKVINNNNKEDNDSNLNNKENNEIENLTDGVKLKNTKKESDKIIQEYEVVLNGKKQNLTLNYELEKTEYYYDIITKLNDIEFYHYASYNPELESYEIGFDKTFTVDFINSHFNEKNFTIIKGLDNKNYLAIYNYVRMHEDFGYIKYYIFNEDLELINKEDILIEDRGQGLLFGEGCDEDYEKCNSGNMWYEETQNIFNYETYQIRAKIEDNKIYALVGGNCNPVNIDEDILEERVYTINNNKLEYEVINTYKIAAYAGATC